MCLRCTQVQRGWAAAELDARQAFSALRTLRSTAATLNFSYRSSSTACNSWKQYRPLSQGRPARMGRRSAPRTSASSAAAAANGAAPTFTSFAAATAQALGAYPGSIPAASQSSSTLHAPSQWDSEALQLLKKLSKRDSTTKLRALHDLTAHIESLGELAPGVGSVFVSAWGEAFKGTVLDDANPGVRTALLKLMRLIVAKFRRLVQPIFPSVLPAWVAAKGDLTSSVGEVASETLNEALSSPAQRTKVVDRYGDDLRAYCTGLLAVVTSGENQGDFLTQALRIIALLSWLVDAAGTPKAVSSIIDDASNPLRLLARGPKLRKKSSTTNLKVGARREVCEFAVQVLKFMSLGNAADEKRAVMFARLALLCIRGNEPVAWDLVLLLLRGKWHAGFGNEFSELAETVGDAVTASIPTGLSALLPLFDSLPSSSKGSIRASERMLSRMRKSLYPLPEGEQNQSFSDVSQTTSVSFMLSALPAYIEASSFVYSTGSERWFTVLESDERDRHRESIAEGHLLPTVRFFLSGQLPPLPKPQQQALSGTRSSRRRLGTSSSSGTSAEIATAVARSLEIVNHELLSRAMLSVAKAFVHCLSARPVDSLERYALFLDALRDAYCRSVIATVVFAQVKTSPIETSGYYYLSALSLTVENCLPRSVLESVEHGFGATGEDFVQKLLRYTSSVWRASTGTISAEVGTSLVKGLGELYSWVYWAAEAIPSAALLDEFWKEVSETADNKERWLVLGEMLHAHEKRRSVIPFSPWQPFRGQILEELVLQAADMMHEAEAMPFVIRLVTAATNPHGGADMPFEVLTRIANVVLQNAKEKDWHDDVYDPVLIALMHSPVHLREAQDPFRELTGLMVLRGSENGAVLEALLSLLEKLSDQRVLEHGRDMLGVLQTRNEASNGASIGKVLLHAKALARVIARICMTSASAAVTLCDDILSWSHPVFTSEILRVVPLRIIFGDGADVPFRHEHFLNTVSTDASLLDGEEHAARFIEFLNSLDYDSVRGVSRLGVTRFLSGEERCLENILDCVSNDNSPEELDARVPFNVISEDILALLPGPGGSLSPVSFERVPDVVRILVTRSKGRCLVPMREILEFAVKTVRRDPFGRPAHVSIDVLSASLTVGEAADDADMSSRWAVPQWLSQLVSIALLAVRRSLERTLGASVEEVHKLETHASTLMSSAIRRVDLDKLGGDNLRFWTLHTKDVLESSAVESGAEKPQESIEWYRTASACQLGSALLQLKTEGDMLRSDMLGDICHYGAWASVGLLPGAVHSNAKTSLHYKVLLREYSEAMSRLVIRSAEMDLLVKEDGRIPVDVERVYALVPLLSSESQQIRKTALTLLAYTAAIDLPGQVSEAFPKDGFADEAEESRFASSLLPEHLRNGLYWSPDCEVGANEEENDKCKRLAHELGYFLAWRLFLDIIRADEVTGRSVLLGDMEEDASLRRVGITFLRTNPGIYEEFFARCAEVVVDGSAKERAAAGIAAEEALKAEELVAQGAQLVQQQESQDEKDEGQEARSGRVGISDGSAGMEERVGRAAGIAFARALQRLPALSRQHVTDRLDRGTALRVESFVRKRISPLLIAAEIKKVKEWGAFGGGQSQAGPSSGSGSTDVESELHARGSVAGRGVWATYTFSDVTLEIGMRLPEVFPLHTVEVEARSRIGMSEARWRKTLLGITTLLRAKDGTLAEAVELWRRNLDKTFQGAEECPICYSVLHLTTAALPKKQCRTCKNLFHADCLCKWFTKSNSSACPLCRSAF